MISTKIGWFIGGENLSHVPSSHLSDAFGFGGTSKTGYMSIGSFG
ncbi:hypothetical protein [Epibacterium ulvae]|nr:hypothetical protein [Epibacterium ulvae]